MKLGFANYPDANRIAYEFGRIRVAIENATEYGDGTPFGPEAARPILTGEIAVIGLARNDASKLDTYSVAFAVVDLDGYRGWSWIEAGTLVISETLDDASRGYLADPDDLDREAERIREAEERERDATR